MRAAFPFLLLPSLWSTRNRIRRRESGDAMRTLLFGGIGVGTALAVFGVVFWLSVRLFEYQDLGEYLLRLGLSWLCMTLLSFLAFSGLVTSLSTFFLSDDLHLLWPAPVPVERLFYGRYLRTAGQAAWMVVAALVPVLLGLGLARCAPLTYYFWALATVVPFVIIPVSAGCLVTLLLVNVFPARRARDVLMLMGLGFAALLIALLRFLQPERLLKVESLPDLTGFFSTFQTPLGPLLPSFWAGEALFSALGQEPDWLHLGSLWTTALASLVITRSAFQRWYFSGWSKAQEARKARFTRLLWLDRLIGWLPLAGPTRALMVKDFKVFLRDTSQWSQLLLLLALGLVYLYNFKALDLSRIPWMGGLLKNLYAFLNLALASFVLSAVAVRFVFPAVSSEGAAFWVVRASPVSMRAFLWSKLWIGWLPLLVLAEGLALTANHFLGVRPELQLLTGIGVAFMSLGLVGLAAGLGAQYPRFSAENITQVAGSYGGVLYMIVAVLFILVSTGLMAWPTATFAWHEFYHRPLGNSRVALMVGCLVGAAALCLLTFWLPMRRGVTALERLER